MPKHIHADLMAQYAQFAQIDNEPWRYFQYGAFDCVDNVIWIDCERCITFDPHLMYRLKPKTIKIGNIDVPKPVREPLKNGTAYYCLDISFGTPDAVPHLWGKSTFDMARLNQHAEPEH
ncbi:hypothetical protein [Xenorhabdus sp. BG5]|uniref:hypothetical protein n=1 Tax=Xenorhabdus sp. BG5 TaxID=2782014 RepID=UPI0018826672|nr:hypothetical protein [Xenorhabdus sp. BG5]MBE8597868.1 hypothetical protein [Xenorhabdus sp. BG5]